MKMKLALATLLASTSVFAETGSGYDRLVEGGKMFANMEHCGGTVTMTETYYMGKRLPLLKFRDMKNCSVVYINGVKQKDKMERAATGGYMDKIILEQPGYNEVEVTLQSGTGSTKDTVVVVSFKEIEQPKTKQANIVFKFGLLGSVFGQSQIADLKDCGGTVKATVEDGDKLTLVFKGLESCSKFDILSADGDSVSYPQKTMQEASNGTHAGSYTIPKRFIEDGKNAIKVIVKSNSGSHDEIILIKFVNL